jgi:hypothetical protein
MPLGWGVWHGAMGPSQSHPGRSWSLGQPRDSPVPKVQVASSADAPEMLGLPFRPNLDYSQRQKHFL